MTIATTAAAMSRRPPETELLANSRKGARTRSIGWLPADPPAMSWLLAPTGAARSGRHHR